MRRTLVFGDIHGCLEELKELLSQVGYKRETDFIVFVGDLIDRGPDPVGVVRFVRELQRQGNVSAVLGNHEEKAARWRLRVEQERLTGKPNAMKPPDPARLAEWNALSEDDLAWIRALPITVEPLSGWIAVHAGFEAVPRTKQRADRMIRVRWLNQESGEMSPIKGDLLQPEGTVYWAEAWKGPENVVYGHAVHSRKNPRVDRPIPGVECWGIDTGACFGGRLTALCLETRQVYQVEASRSYADLAYELTD